MFDDKEEMLKVCELLRKSKTVAVVGLSRVPTKTSREIANYLVAKKFNVVGVNPMIDEAELDGIKIYRRLTDIPHAVDIVNVFRRSEDIPQIIDDVIALKPKALWLQEGIRNDDAVKPVESMGIFVLQDKCIAVYYSLCSKFINS